MYQVVIVEDDPMVAMLNRRYTEKDPRFQVCRECPDGRAALEYLRSHPADLVILDMYMPQMDGLDVLRQLRAAGVSTDVIMITAASDTATVEAAMRLGVVDYLVKPFEYDRFCQALDAFDRRRQAIRAAIDALPEHHRTVILLRELDGMSYQDIAKVMGLTEGTVKSRINRARARLRQLLLEGNFFEERATKEKDNGARKEVRQA